VTGKAKAEPARGFGRAPVESSKVPATMPAPSGKPPRRGAWIAEVWHSSVGKKYIVAITGVIFVAYVVAHMAGNLKAFQGAGSGEAPIDSYGEWIRTVGEPVIPHSGVLWAVRAVLLAALVIHVVAVVQLAKRNSAARPDGHPAPRIRRTLSTRTMLPGGLFLLAFVVFHILHFTTGTVDPGSFASGAVFANLVGAFDSPFMVAIYVAAPIALGFHLRHGIWSAVQTAGWDKPNRNPTIRRTANWLSVIVAAGFIAVPIALWAGIVD